MDYKKFYEEALERAKKNYDATQDLCNGSQIGVECFKNTLTNIFPELKESEDERIRKALLEMVHDTTGDELWVDYNVHKEEALAWLEKQGEQKPVDKVESFDKYEGLTDFERTLVDICIDWIGEELDWK